MADRSPADGGALSAEQLLTGIGKLIYSLNESVLGIGGRLERLESTLTSMMERSGERLELLTEKVSEPVAAQTPSESADLSVLVEKLDILALLMERTNESLRELVEKASIPVETEPSPDGAALNLLAAKMDDAAALADQTNVHLSALVEVSRLQAAGPAVDLTPVVDAVTSAVDGLREAVTTGPAVLAVMSVSLDDIREKLADGQGALAPLAQSISDQIRAFPPALETASAGMEKLLSGLEELRSAVGAMGPEVVSGMTEATGGMQPILESVREKLSSLDGIMINLYEAMKSMSETRSGEMNAESLRTELDRMAAGLAESAGLLGRTLSEAVEKSDGSRSGLLDEKLAPVVDGLSAIDASLSSLHAAMKGALGGMHTGADERVEALSAAVGKSIEEQAAQLARMTELLTVHAAGVRESRAVDLNRRAIGFYNSGDYPAAGGLLREAIELSPGSPELHANLAHVEAASGNLEEAEACFRKALEADPKLEPAISGLGALMVLGGRSDDGIEFLSGFISGGGEQSPGVMLALARAYAASGRHRDAITLLETALRAAPGHPGIEQELSQYREESPSE
jgi:tetratricopeptide (TPR) repeat protein